MTINSNSPDAATGAAGLLAMAFVAAALFGNSYVYDSIGPVAALLQNQIGFTDTQIGTLNAIYSIPNVFRILVGGILVCRCIGCTAPGSRRGMASPFPGA